MANTKKTFYEKMDGYSLKRRIESIQSLLLHYVDHQTIWYAHAQHAKQHPEHQKQLEEQNRKHPNYTEVILTNKQKKDCLEALQWLERDVKACIAHLKY
jgi:hypothetical protein